MKRKQVNLRKLLYLKLKTFLQFVFVIYLIYTYVYTTIFSFFEKLKNNKFLESLRSNNKC